MLDGVVAVLLGLAGAHPQLVGLQRAVELHAREQFRHDGEELGLRARARVLRAQPTELALRRLHRPLQRAARLRRRRRLGARRLRLGARGDHRGLRVRPRIHLRISLGPRLGLGGDGGSGGGSGGITLLLDLGKRLGDLVAAVGDGRELEDAARALVGGAVRLIVQLAEASVQPNVFGAEPLLLALPRGERAFGVLAGLLRGGERLAEHRQLLRHRRRLPLHLPQTDLGDVAPLAVAARRRVRRLELGEAVAQLLFEAEDVGLRRVELGHHARVQLLQAGVPLLQRRQRLAALHRLAHRLGLLRRLDAHLLAEPLDRLAQLGHPLRLHRRRRGLPLQPEGLAARRELRRHALARRLARRRRRRRRRQRLLAPRRTGRPRRARRPRRPWPRRPPRRRGRHRKRRRRGRRRRPREPVEAGAPPRARTPATVPISRTESAV